MNTMKSIDDRLQVKDWIKQCFTSPPTQYRLYWRRFLQVKRPNQQYQSTERENCKWQQRKKTKENRNYTYAYTHKIPDKYSKSPSLRLYEVTRGRLPQRAGCQAWTTVGLPPRYPHM